MSEFIRADIFFFVTTISVAILSVLIAVALIYLLRILKDVRDITGKARMEGEFILHEVRRMRERARDKRSALVSLFILARRIIERYRY